MFINGSVFMPRLILFHKVLVIREDLEIHNESGSDQQSSLCKKKTHVNFISEIKGRSLANP